MEEEVVIQIRELLGDWNGESFNNINYEQYLVLDRLAKSIYSTEYGIRELLKEAGYISDSIRSKIAFDRKYYYKTKWYYGIELQEIDFWFNISRSTGSNRAISDSGYWSGKKLNCIETQTVTNMVENSLFLYDDGYLSIRILNSRNHEPMIFIIDGIEVKIIEQTDMPDDIKTLIIETGMNEIMTRNPIEFDSKFYNEFYNRFLAISDSNGNVDLNLNRHLYLDLEKFFRQRGVKKKYVEPNIWFYMKKYHFRKFNIIMSEINKSYLLSDIVDIDIKMRRNIYQRSQQNRSISLSSKLKEYYGYFCQLCDPSGEGIKIPVIPFKDRVQPFYVEMHHLKPMATYNPNEDELLDAAWNAIVVCSYHHKVLHFHRYKFDTKISYDSKQDKFYIGSELGSKLIVYLDDHFRKIHSKEKSYL